LFFYIGKRCPPLQNPTGSYTTPYECELNGGQYTAKACEQYCYSDYKKNKGTPLVCQANGTYTGTPIECKKIWPGMVHTFTNQTLHSLLCTIIQHYRKTQLMTSRNSTSNFTRKTIAMWNLRGIEIFLFETNFFSQSARDFQMRYMILIHIPCIFFLLVLFSLPVFIVDLIEQWNSVKIRVAALTQTAQDIELLRLNCFMLKKEGHLLIFFFFVIYRTTDNMSFQYLCYTGNRQKHFVSW